MIGSDWVVGDKIVCVDASVFHNGLGPNLSSPMVIYLVEDKIYVLQAISELDGALIVDVDGIPRAREGLPNFLSTRFRKVLPDKAEGNKEDFKLLLETHKSKEAPVNVPAKIPDLAPALPYHPLFAPFLPRLRRQS